MAIANYSELKDETIGGKDSFSHRDLLSKADIFCALAEAVINKDLRSLDMEKRLAITFDDAYEDLPSDYMEYRALHIENDGARCPIKQYSPQQLDSLYSRATGTVSGFAIHGGQMEVRPAPSVSATVDGELTYFARVPTLVTNSTNDILTKFPMIYLSAMMIQVYLYLQEDDELRKWSDAYNSQIKVANKSAQGGRYALPQVQAV